MPRSKSPCGIPSGPAPRMPPRIPGNPLCHCTPGVGTALDRWKIAALAMDLEQRAWCHALREQASRRAGTRQALAPGYTNIDIGMMGINWHAQHAATASSTCSTRRPTSRWPPPSSERHARSSRAIWLRVSPKGIYCAALVTITPTTRYAPNTTRSASPSLPLPSIRSPRQISTSPGKPECSPQHPELLVPTT